MVPRALRRMRLRAAAVDELLIAMVAVLLFAMAVQTGAAAMAALALAWLLGPLAPTEASVVPVLAGASWLVVRLVYGTLGEGGPTGGTPGKRLVGLRVSKTDGGPPGYGRALLRQITKTLAVVSVVGLLAAATGRCWHDLAAGTRVSEREPAE